MPVCKSSSFIVHLVIFMRIQQKINLYSCFILMKKKNYLSLDLVPKLLIFLSPFFCTWTIIQRYPNLPQYRYLLEHNFTLGLLPIYIVHINENNQRLVNSYEPNIFINMTRKAPKDTTKEIRFTFFFSIAKVKAVVR